MNDHFENSLRDTLRRATPSAPDEPTRAEGARAYAARTRRRRTGFLAAGATAVVVAAITIVPTVLDRSDGRGDPAAGPPQTQASQQDGELPDQPLECPSDGGPTEPMATPPDGVIEPGAALVRVCAVEQEGTPWTPPLDALTSDIDAVATAFNDLPVAEDRMPCTEELGPAYLMVFQYPDGRTVQVRGDLYGCRLVSFGALERQGADEALNAYFDALLAQRSESDPPPASSLRGLTCPDSAGMYASTLVPQPPAELVLAQASVCSYDSKSLEPRRTAELGPDQVAAVSADLKAHSDEQGQQPQCLVAPDEHLELVVRNEHGDVITLSQSCDVFTYADKYWTPTPATLDMLRSALR